MFCHVTKARATVVFTSIEVVKELVEKTFTSIGLKVFASIKVKVYKTAEKASADFKANMPIVADDYLGLWNYRTVPQTG